MLYGLILLVLGIAGSHTVKTKAAGINVDLWTGLAMLVFAALMIFWALSRPIVPEPPETRGEGSGRIRRAPGHLSGRRPARYCERRVDRDLDAGQRA